MDDNDELLTVSEVAARVRVNPETVRRWIRSGRLRAWLAGTNQAGFRIRSSDLVAFLEGARQLPLPGDNAKKAAA